jgi:biotin carboxyl carrier protein
MITAKVNDNLQFEIDMKSNHIKLNGEAVTPDWTMISENKYHAIINNQSLTIELTNAEEDGKNMSIVVNGIKYQVELQNQFDALLKQLGMDKLATNKVNSIKAPMPGLVLRISVAVGDVIKKGDNLLVLEAMKMENSIKAPADATIKSVKITAGDKVEKNQVMILLA